ncbi:MAG: hypothetical protein WA324_12460, partial [Bryobacteraceae bacterium]
MMGHSGGSRAAQNMTSTPQREYTSLQRLSIRSKPIAMICLSIVSLAGLGALFFAAINEVKVSGPIYKAIAREMDLRSDILPPPEFIVETHLTALQIERAMRADPSRISALVKKLDGLKHDYDHRQTYWKDALPASTPLELQIRDGIQTASKGPATKYFQILFGEFLPAVQQKDDQRANLVIDTELAPLYVQHKAAIERLADLTEKSQSLREQEAGQRITSRIALLVVLIVLSLALLLGVGIYVMVSVTAPLQVAVTALQRVADHDLTAHLSVTNDDEVGAM